MKTEELIEELVKVSDLYPNLTKIEVIELMKLKEMMRIK
jgi:hypothetical protein